MKPNDKIESFKKSLCEANIKNIEVGYIENYLFGNAGSLIDENNVKNNKIEVFYFIKKAQKENAPYLVFLNGGPGIAVSDMFLHYRYDSFLPNVNVVFFDQRGNGFSHQPLDDIHELKYYSAKYIISDSEKIREKILGKNSKWIVFGQSYGGVVARKYIEYAPSSIQKVITHGSAKYDAVDVAVNMEINTLNRLNLFFSKFPEDRLLLESIKKELKDSDTISSQVFCIKGKGIIHLLALLFSIKSDEDFHAYLGSLESSNLKQSFLNSIKPFSELVLTAGMLNQAVAQIDIIGNIASGEVTKLAKEMLIANGMDVKNLLISKLLFDQSLITTSKDLKKLEGLFEKQKIKTDTVNLDTIVQLTNEMNIQVDVFGGETDTLSINAIRNEENYIRNSKAKNIRYHYSKGHHREWLTNSEMFQDFLY